MKDNFVLVVNKEKDMTSRDVVNNLTHLFNTKKIGHTGTLDPMATGVLVICVNKYTKLVNMITSHEKEYIAKIKLGIKTDTLDITGNIISKSSVDKLEVNNIKNALNSFIGKINQEVPIYSAVSINGKRLYEYARENKEVELPVRTVVIKDIELISYDNDEITIKVVCSSGTYIRSLIRDICDKLNVLGTMSYLCRTRQGNFKIEDSYTLSDIQNGIFKTLSIEDIINIDIIDVDDEIYKKINNGVKMNINKYTLYKYNNKNISLYDNNGKLLIKY